MTSGVRVSRAPLASRPPSSPYLVRLLGGRVPLADPAGRPRHVEHGHVRDGRPVGEASPLEIGDAAVRQAVAELEQEPGLADAGFPDDPDGLSPALHDGGEEVLQGLELSIAADEVAEPARPVTLERRASRAHAEEAEHDDRLGAAPHGDGSHALAADVALDEPPRRLADQDGARLGGLLEAGRQVRRVADRGVVHPQVVADRAHDHEAGVKPHAHGERDILARRDGNWPLAERARDTERRERSPPRVILMGQRGPEERHEPVAEELVDGALVAVDLGEGGLEELVDEDVHALRPQPFRQRGRADQVAEEHGDWLALAFQHAARGEDPLGEVARRVRGRRSAVGRSRRRRRGPRPAGGDGVAALEAELRRVRELRAARGAGRGEPLPALVAELRPRRILVPTPRARHGGLGNPSCRGATRP